MPHFFVSSPWLIPRSNIGYGVLIVFPILYYCLYAKSSNIFNYLFTGIIVITLLFMYKSSLNLVHNEIQNEVLNTIESKKIIASIDEYQQNKQKINKIVTYSDLNPTYSYPNIIAEGDINVRPLAYDWALKSTLTFNSGTSFNEGKQNKEIKDYCQKNDWDSFSLDQLKYEGDTLYVCIY